MYLNINFADGANPWLCYGDSAKLKRELKKWQRNYDVYTETTPEGNINAIAYNKIKGRYAK